LVSGTVTSVRQNRGELLVTYRTDSSYGVSCRLAGVTAAPHLGTTLTVLTVGHAAEGQPGSVVLRDCVIP
jgi:hypothetical protein